MEFHGRFTHAEPLGDRAVAPSRHEVFEHLPFARPEGRERVDDGAVRGRGGQIQRQHRGDAGPPSGYRLGIEGAAEGFDPIAELTFEFVDVDLPETVVADVDE